MYAYYYSSRCYSWPLWFGMTALVNLSGRSAAFLNCFLPNVWPIKRHGTATKKRHDHTEHHVGGAASKSSVRTLTQQQAELQYVTMVSLVDNKTIDS